MTSYEEIIKSPDPPASEVSVWTGVAGLAGLLAALTLAFGFQQELHIAYKTLELLAFTAAPMLLLEAIRSRAIREFVRDLRASLRWRRLDRDQNRIAAVRLIGLFAILAPIAAGFYIFPDYLPTRHQFLYFALTRALPVLFAALLFYWSAGVPARPPEGFLFSTRRIRAVPAAPRRHRGTGQIRAPHAAQAFSSRSCSACFTARCTFLNRKSQTRPGISSASWPSGTRSCTPSTSPSALSGIWPISSRSIRTSGRCRANSRAGWSVSFAIRRL